MTSQHIEQASLTTNEVDQADSRTYDNQSARKKLPISTMTVIGITSICTGLQFLYPSVLAALRRNPDALAAGEWWRMFTPLLVHDGGLGHFAYVLVGLIIVGLTVERLFGSWRWLLLYLAGGLVGEIAGYAWDPDGAGASVAMCGLMGGLFIWLLRRRESLSLLVALYLVSLVAALSGAVIGGLIPVILLCVLASSAIFWMFKLHVSSHIIRYSVSFFGLAGALFLLLFHDIHGASLLAGASVAVLLFWVNPHLRRYL
ncbi:rhomboid family intramembrane serine protease [Ktedonobacter racemifer]|nr:rhomboid family intramembrane serine protease [Ktedonobacter racemifer]